MKIDIEIRHVTKPGANIFLELGFAPAEAKRLQAASRAQRVFWLIGKGECAIACN